MIKGITDRPRYFPRIGKIRLGVKDAQRGYPKDTDHFVLTDVPEVAEVYGKTPKKLIVTFPSNNIEQVFPTRLEHWKSRKAQAGDATQRSTLFCSSDGETATRLYIGQERDPQGHEAVQKMPQEERPELMEMFQMPCPHEDCPYYESRDCKRVGRLTFVLPEVSFGGVYQIETSSMYGFGNILDTLSWVQGLSGGRLVGAFFELSREPQSMKIPDTGKVTIKHVLTLKVVTAAERISKLTERVPPWLLHGPGLKQLGPAQHDRPEDLFPEDQQVLAEAPAPDPLASEEMRNLAKMAGMGKAQFGVLCAKLGGDVDRIKQHVKDLLDSDINDTIPLTKPAGPIVGALPNVDPPKSNAVPEAAPAEPEQKTLLDGW